MAKAEYRSAIRSRTLIVNALVELLQKKPLEKITVTDIVNRAQINRGTFYSHYDNVEDVMQYIIRQSFAPIQTALSEQPQQLMNVAEILLRQIQSIIESEMSLFQKVMTSASSAYVQQQFVFVVEEYMLQHEQDYSYGNHEDYVFLIRFCAGGLSNLYHDWFCGKQNISLNELTRKATDIVNTLIAPK